MDTHDIPPQSHLRETHTLRIDPEPKTASNQPHSPIDSPATPASASQRRRSSTTALTLPPDDFSPANTSPTSGPQRTSRPSTATSSRSGGSKESHGSEAAKRKRSRVTPEQLQHLERLFAQDRSPTAARRKEISEMLGMQERQTQIWFQNRRAKAKNQDTGKSKPLHNSASPPATPPEHMLAHFDQMRLALVHEDHPVSFLPCDDLTIGNWRRIASVTQTNDLIAYTCDAKRCLSWYIQSSGYGFKMEIPYDMVARVNVTTASSRPDTAHVSFFLSGTPTFFLENTVPTPIPSAVTLKAWCHCQDWTEGAQASNVFKHEVVGPYGPLVAALRMLPIASRITGLDTAMPVRPDVIMPLQLPPPPLASLQSAPPIAVPFPFTEEQPAPLPHLMGRRRSISGPTSSQVVHQQPGFSASTGHLHQYNMNQPVRPSTMAAQYGISTYQNPSQESLFRFAPPGLSQPSPPHANIGEYVAPASAPYPSQMPGSAGGMLQSPMYDVKADHIPDISRFPGSAGGHSFGSASPPLLTQPFQPHSHMGTMGANGSAMHGVQMHGLNVDTAMVPPHPPFFDDQMTGLVPSPLGTNLTSEGHTISQRSSSSSLDGALGLSMPVITPPQLPQP